MDGSKIAHFGLVRQYKKLTQELLEATHQSLSSGCLVDGPFTKQFEKWLRKKTGARYASVVHSGSQALEFMAHYEYIDALAITQAVPKIALPNITYPATLNAFINAGWEVTIHDTDKNGLKAWTRDTSPLDYDCFVGLYGASPDMSTEDSWGMITDGAQHWLEANGNFGIGMAISFDPTKNLNGSGNGGAVVTNHQPLYEFIKNYKNNGKPMHAISGTNSRMSEQDCAQILVRTRYIDEWQARRKNIRLYYIDRLKGLPLRCLSEGFERHADQKFVIYVEGDRNKLLSYLLDNNIEAKIHYNTPLSELPITKELNLPRPDMLSVSMMLCKGVISLPIYPELHDTEVEYICNIIKKFYDK